MYLFMTLTKLSASIAKKAIFQGGITLVIFLLIISLTCLILYIILDNKNK